MRANGYTIVWKDLLTKPEFWRLAKRVREHAGAPLSDADAESRALGYLTKLWLLADSHIADDDTLDMGPDEVDQFLGVAGLAQLLGPNWLEILDADQVRLPNWLAHNGVQAKKQARAFARKQRYDAKQQERKSVLTGTQDRSIGNGTELPPLPSLPIPSQPSPTPKTKIPTAASPPAGFEEFRKVYPKRSGDPGWKKAQRAWNARLTENHSPQDFIRGAERYAAYCLGTGKVGSEYVQQASTFLGPGKAFLLPWALPPKVENASERILRKLREPEAIEHESESEYPALPHG